MKNKFNPKDVPSWCKWITADMNGDCFGFDEKPTNKEDPTEWLPQGFVGRDVLLYTGKPPKNWKDELYTWGY